MWVVLDLDSSYRANASLYFHFRASLDMMWISVVFLVVGYTMSQLHHTQLQLASAVRDKQTEVTQLIYKAAEELSEAQNQVCTADDVAVTRDHDLLSQVDVFVSRLRLQLSDLSSSVEASCSPPRLLSFAVSNSTFKTTMMSVASVLSYCIVSYLKSVLLTAITSPVINSTIAAATATATTNNQDAIRDL